MVALVLADIGPPSTLSVLPNLAQDPPRAVRIRNDDTTVTCDAGRLLRALRFGPDPDEDESVRWVIAQMRS
jgi:hypothetical protein